MKTSPFAQILLVVSFSLLFGACSEKEVHPDYKSCTATQKSDKAKSMCWQSTAFTFDTYDDADEYCTQALGNLLEIDSGVVRASYSIEATEECDPAIAVKCEKLRSDLNYKAENSFYLYGGMLTDWCAVVK